MIATQTEIKRHRARREEMDRATDEAIAKRVRDVLEREYTEAEHARATERFYRDLEAEQEADRYAAQADPELGPLEKAVLMYPHPPALHTEPADNDADGEPVNPPGWLIAAAAVAGSGLVALAIWWAFEPWFVQAVELGGAG